MIRPLIAILAFVLLGACVAVTPVASYRDPDAVKGYGSVMVLARQMSLAERQAAEAAVVEALTRRRVTVIKGLDRLPPTRDYAPGDAENAARGAGAETLLTITRTEGERRTEYVQPYYGYPPWRYYGPSYGYFWPYPYVEPGYTVEWLRADFTADLVDLGSGRKAWTGEVGASDGSFPRLAAVAGKRIAARLLEDGLFGK